MLRFKPGVRVRYFRRQLGAVLEAASLWSARAGVDVDVNSIDDAAAGRGVRTFHGLGLALDLDTEGDRPEDLDALADYLDATLEVDFDVVREGTHAHVEWDARRRRQLKMGR